MTTLHEEASPETEGQRNHVIQLLRQFSTAMLVTHAGDNQLRARPMEIVHVEDTGYAWFITHIDTAKAHEIAEDTHVHIVCQNDRSAYLSISGKATLDQNRIKIDVVWKDAYKVWFPEGKTDPNITLIAVALDEAEYWDNQGMKRLNYLFEATKAYVTGTTVDVREGEEHGFVKL